MMTVLGWTAVVVLVVVIELGVAMAFGKFCKAGRGEDDLDEEHEHFAMWDRNRNAPVCVICDQKVEA